MQHPKLPSYPIQPVLEEYGADLSRARYRGWSKIRCPFHDDHSPSATVNLQANRFHCWSGCTERAEDTVGLVMHIEGCDFLSAVKEAERITGLERDPLRKNSGTRTSIFDQPWDN